MDLVPRGLEVHPRTMGGGDRGNEMAEQSGGLYSISLTLGCLVDLAELVSWTKPR